MTTIVSTITRWIECLIRLVCAWRSVWRAVAMLLHSRTHDPARVTSLNRPVMRIPGVLVTIMESIGNE